MKFTINKLTRAQKRLRRRILEISFKKGLSHLGSCLSAVDGIMAVYAVKKKNEKFVLSNGHAGVALYAVLGNYSYDFHVHPDRNSKQGIDVSTGSLGMGLPIAVGLALANRKKNVYVMVSDGEMSEGSMLEALRVAFEQRLSNLKIILNANGWSAYDKVNLSVLLKRIKAFCSQVIIIDGHDIEDLMKALKKRLLRPHACQAGELLHFVQSALAMTNEAGPSIIFSKTTVEQLPFLKGQDSHYHIMTKEEYRLGMEMFR